MMSTTGLFVAPSARILAFARTWTFDALDATAAKLLRARVRALDVELIVVCRSGAWAFGPGDDDFGEYRDRIPGDPAIDATLVAAPCNAMFVIDGEDVIRVGRGADSLLEALDTAAAVLVAHRVAATVPAIPFASLHRWVEELAS